MICRPSENVDRRRSCFFYKQGKNWARAGIQIVFIVAEFFANGIS